MTARRAQNRHTQQLRALAAVVLAIALLSNCRSSLETQGSDAIGISPVARVFGELLADVTPSTRMEACFLSVGLPCLPNVTRILRRRVLDAEPLERVISLYALAAMTRNQKDINAFLDAFPTEPQLFFDLIEAEWELSATFNTGMADFLLLLAYDPRTRQKALPHLARIVRNMPGELETMKAYSTDPLVHPYIDVHEDTLLVDERLWKKEYSIFIKKTDSCSEKIVSLIQHDEITTQVTAWKILQRMKLSNKGMERSKGFEQELPKDSRYASFVELDAERLSAMLSSDPGTIVDVLHRETSMYRPPLQGLAGALWHKLVLDDAIRAQLRAEGENGLWARRNFDAGNRARLLRILDSMMEYGREYLEICEIVRLMPYSQRGTPCGNSTGNF